MRTDDIGEGKGRACGHFPSQIFPREGAKTLLYKGLLTSPIITPKKYIVYTL